MHACSYYIILAIDDDENAAGIHLVVTVGSAESRVQVVLSLHFLLQCAFSGL